MTGFIPYVTENPEPSKVKSQERRGKNEQRRKSQEWAFPRKKARQIPPVKVRSEERRGKREERRESWENLYLKNKILGVAVRRGDEPGRSTPIPAGYRGNRRSPNGLTFGHGGTCAGGENTVSHTHLAHISEICVISPRFTHDEGPGEVLTSLYTLASLLVQFRSRYVRKSHFSLEIVTSRRTLFTHLQSRKDPEELSFIGA